jgi:hypothetical protein
MVKSQGDKLEQYLTRTTEEAAQAGRSVIEFLLGLPNVSWKINKATIDSRAERQFCSLWPVKKHITLWLTKTESVHDPQQRLRGEGRTANLKLRTNKDVDSYLKKLIRQSYKSEGLRPLKS